MPQKSLADSGIDGIENGTRHIHTSLEYDSINLKVLSTLPPTCRNVLDLGCGGGSLGKAISVGTGASVVGVTFNEREAERARSVLRDVVVADLNTLDVSTLPNSPYDCIICCHVLEHLYDPKSLLMKLRDVIGPQGVLIVALPNVLFWKQRLRFFAGRFRYTDGGLMDRTHFRFFDWHSANELVRESGYTIEQSSADGVLPLARLVPGMRDLLNRAALKAFPGVFGWQVVIRARPNPSL